MRRFAYCSIALLLLTLAIGCGDSYDKVAADMVTNVTNVRDTLRAVTDAPTAVAAAEKIKALGVEMNHTQSRFNTLGKPSKEVGDELNAKYKVQLNQIGDDIKAERARIVKLGPDVSGPIDNAMKTAMTQ